MRGFVLFQDQIKKPELRLFFFISLISSLPAGLFPQINFNYIMQSGPWISLFLASLCLEPILKISNVTQGNLIKSNRITMAFFNHGFNLLFLQCWQVQAR